MSLLPFPPATTSDAIDLFRQDVSILHEVVHGDENAEVLTDNGLIPSVENVIQDIQSRVNPALDALTITAPFDFNTGGTVTARNQVVLWSTANGGDGREYRWAGALPKTVPAASTPATTGGISDSAWVYTANAAFEQEIAAVDSDVLVGGVEASVLSNQFVSIKRFSAVGDGATDDTAAVTDWLTYLAANPNKIGFVDSGTYLINTVSITATNGLNIIGAGKFRALGSNRLNMIALSGVEGIVRLDGFTVDGSNIVARPFEVKNIGGAAAGNVYVGQGCRFINAKNVSPLTANASGFRVQGKFNHVIFEGEIDGVDNSLTSGAVSVGAWFDWTGADFINNVIVTSKARIKNVKNDNTVTADADGIQRMGPTNKHLFFTVEEGAYFENCKGRSIKSQVVGNSINSPVIVRDAYDGLVEIDLQYSGGHCKGAKIYYDGVKTLGVISATTRLGLASDMTMAHNTLNIVNPPVSNTGVMCSFSASDNTDTVVQNGLMAFDNKVIGGTVDHMVSIRVANVVNTNRATIRNNYAEGIGTAFINMFEVFNTPAQLDLLFEGNYCKSQCEGITISGGGRLRVEVDRNNKNIKRLPPYPEFISGGTLTLFGGDCILVGNEGGAGVDDVTNITGGNYSSGDTVVFKAYVNSQVPTFKNGLGNIFLAGSDFTLDSIRDRLVLSYDADVDEWHEVSRSNNG